MSKVSIRHNGEFGAPVVDIGYQTIERDPERIAAILGALVRHGARAELRTSTLRIPIVLLTYCPQLEIVQSEVRGAIVPPGRFLVVVEGYNSLFQFKVNQYFQHDWKLTMATPSEISKHRHRWQRRAAVNDLDIRIALFDGSRAVVPIRDISYHGFSFYDRTPGVCNWDVGGVVRGEILEAQRPPIPVCAEVMKTALSGDSEICHMRIARSVDEIGRNQLWDKLVNDRLHPRTQIGSGYTAEIWQLFLDSGYFKLSDKSHDDFEGGRSAHRNILKTLDSAPQIGCQVVWPVEGGIDAALSVLKVYRHTWMGLHLARVSGRAKDGTPGRKVLRHVHLRAFEHALRDPQIRWYLVLMQVKLVWSRMVHYELPRRFVDADEAYIVRCQVLEYSVTELPTPQYSGVAVERASAAEARAVASAIQEIRPEPYCEALDVVPERMGMVAIGRLYNQGGLRRKRAVFVVRRLGNVVAAAIVEMATDGLHVFGLLDCVRLYSIVPGGDDFFANLLGPCSEWFRAHGKEKFCVYLEEGQRVSDTAYDAATDLGAADMIILAAKRLPELLEHLYEVTAPRPRTIEVSEIDPQ